MSKLAVVALNAAITLHDNVQSFEPRNSEAQALLQELQALKDILKPAAAITDASFYDLDIPLRRCANACQEFDSALRPFLLRPFQERKGFKGWAKLDHVNRGVTGFRYSLAAYRSAFTIALTDITLYPTSALIKDHGVLIKETIVDLDHQLKEVGGRLEASFGPAVKRSLSKGHPLTRESPQPYRLLHGLLSTGPKPEEGDKSQLLTDGSSLAPEKSINNACEEDLIAAIAPSQEQVLKLVDQLVIELKEELSQREVADLLVLRDEWEAMRQSLSICIEADRSYRLQAAKGAGAPDIGFSDASTSSSGRLGLQAHECGDLMLADSIKSVLEPCFSFEELSEEEKKERGSLLSGLESEPPSSRLQAFLETFKTGSLTWDVETDLNTFVKGLECLADLCGPGRDSYYSTPLKGLHSINSFKELWNQAHPQHPITPWDPDQQLQCPPSWSSRFEKKIDWGWVLTYEGDAPLSQGLDELFVGPTILDCGMWCQLFLWMGIRFLLGDDVFYRSFRFKKGEFILTQSWNHPINQHRTDGNLLHPFYDDPKPSATDYRIHTKTVANDPAYSIKHPGGTARLQNFTQIDNRCFVFGGTEGSQNVLSDEELEAKLRHDYNLPQHLADRQQMHLFSHLPDAQHPFYGPLSYGTLAARAAMYAHHTLSEVEWKARRGIRQELSCGAHLAFNFRRLLACVKEAELAYQAGEIHDDVLTIACRRDVSDEPKDRV